MSGNLIRAIVDANTTRKDSIAESILQRRPNVVGIYRLTDEISDIRDKVYMRDLFGQD